MVYTEEDNETLSHLLKAAAVASGFSISAIKSDSRQVPLPFVRSMLYTLLREEYQWSLVRVGRVFRRVHATVYSGIKRYHAIIDETPCGYQMENIINEKFKSYIMLPNREKRIKNHMNAIRKIASDLPEGKKNAISNHLDRISLELKKDRPENKVKTRRLIIQ
ncbi:MAG: hypothetical protein J5732_00885 [Bacteroidaceae bacterium]|nr:hypothetical protein [Bacteroidaceae bacterium]